MAKLSVDQALRRAKTYERDGNADGARKIYETVLESFPHNNQAQQGLAALGGGRGGAQRSPALPKDEINQLVSLLNQGQVNLVVRQAGKLVAEFPSSSTLWNILGVASARTGQSAKAEKAFQAACKLTPNASDAHNNLGNVLKDQGKLDAAVASFKRALQIKPDYTEAHNNLGNALSAQGKLDAAVASYKRALKIKPDYTGAHNNLGNVLRDQGKLEAAVASFKRALKIKPDYAEAHNNMGNALKDQGRLGEAVASYTRALQINPDYAEAHNNMGTALKDQGKLDEAVARYKRALKIKPDYASALNNLGVALKDEGKFEQASASYTRALEIKPDYAEAHLNLSASKKYSADDSQLDSMLQLHADKNTGPDSRCQLCFGIAKAYEDIGEIQTSFSFLKEGNALRKKLLGYNIDQDRKLFASIKSNARQLPFHAPNRNSGSPGPIPIFILGMPRSGTTLTEQIISCHSQVEGAGELTFAWSLGRDLLTGKRQINDDALTRFRDEYLGAVSRLSNGKAFVTDKMPHNFRVLGLLATAIPEARIIHVRRDPAATCWSNFRQYFRDSGLGYSNDLTDVVDFYGLYKDLMEFWGKDYSDRIYELDYERLANNQEDETRKLIAFAGLKWEDACLAPQKNKRSVSTASQQQVRREVYRGSSSQWRKFEPYLEGAFDRLLTEG
ncbi:MAG: tetratricopeptide repeat protein [Paracoccaceae bacterium]